MNCSCSFYDLCSSAGYSELGKLKVFRQVSRRMEKW